MNIISRQHSAVVPRIVREEIIEDELADEMLARRLARERLIPAISFNVDFEGELFPEYMFSLVEAEFQQLGFEVGRVQTVNAHSYSRLHLRVSSTNRLTKQVRMAKLIVILVEGKFFSVTSFPLT